MNYMTVGERIVSFFALDGDLCIGKEDEILKGQQKERAERSVDVV